MSHKKRIFLGSLLLLLNVSPFAAAQQAESSLLISLTANGARELSHDPVEPILLVVGISYPAAANAAMTRDEHERRKELFKEKGWFEKMSGEEKERFEAVHKVPEGPVLSAGSASKPFERLLAFKVTDKNGEPVSLPIRPLASSPKTEAIVTFNEETSLMLFFGADPEALSKLGDGVYEVRAELDQRFFSSGVSVTLAHNLKSGTAQEIDRRDYLSGRFYVLDYKWDQAEAYAAKMLSRDADSIEGLELRGDALAGQGKLQEAQDAFLKALAAFQRKYPELKGAEEPPEYLFARLSEIQKKIT